MTLSETREDAQQSNPQPGRKGSMSQSVSEDDSDNAGIGDEQDLAWAQMCKANIDTLLTKKKGFTAQQAKAFRKQHLKLWNTRINYEDMGLDEVRTVEARFAVTHTPVEGAGEVVLRGQHDYHLRRRFTIEGEYSAEASFDIHGGGCDAAGSFFDCDEEEGVFKLTKADAAAIQTALGPEWSPYEAVMFVFAALGVPYNDGKVRIASHCDLAPRLMTSDEFETVVTSVAKDDKPKVKGGAKREGAASNSRVAKQAKLAPVQADA